MTPVTPGSGFVVLQFPDPELDEARRLAVQNPQDLDALLSYWQLALARRQRPTGVARLPCDVEP